MFTGWILMILLRRNHHNHQFQPVNNLLRRYTQGAKFRVVRVFASGGRSFAVVLALAGGGAHVKGCNMNGDARCAALQTTKLL